MLRVWMLWVMLLAWGSQVQAITVGAEQPGKYLPLLEGKRVGLVVNHTSRVGDTHLVDFLLDNNIQVAQVMAPEHGFRGKLGAGEKVHDDRDPKTGVPLLSLYGATKKPTAAMLNGVDVLVFDIQDVGARFYTYISTLHYVLEAAAQYQTPVIVLDRPNPNGAFVDGPLREPAFASFVGVDPLPVLHGMTVAELARMIKGEQWIEQADELRLQVVPVANYTRDMSYTLPVAPSPNLPNDQAISLYPSLVFFEATRVSVGRGTLLPFQIIGHHQVPLGALTLTPQSRPEAPAPKLKGNTVYFKDLRQSNITGLDLSVLINTYQIFKKAGEPFFDRPDFMDKLAGTDALRKAILAGHDEAQIRASWQTDLARFKQRRRPYLLYP
ncbi:DUF1343 domain-containing protein [Salinimonas marina]|uniref:DUF1343 domain-containing protein n=1 Tax=Salinimonas marina TaxID=2785918 RepID=A0A7S9DWV8_9ALTE|nr:DUF1343 domain-containing protein [Salinimonas marina]QPG05355.1 DUF1343 domain-containing protein [Salinimonas marina]